MMFIWKWEQDFSCFFSATHKEKWLIKEFFIKYLLLFIPSLTQFIGSPFFFLFFFLFLLLFFPSFPPSTLPDIYEWTLPLLLFSLLDFLMCNETTGLRSKLLSLSHTLSLSLSLSLFHTFDEKRRTLIKYIPTLHISTSLADAK